MSATAPTSGAPTPGAPASGTPTSGAPAPGASASAPAGDGPAPRPRPGPRTGLPPRLGVLVEVAVVPVLVSYAVVVVLAALITASASGTSPGGEPGLAQALASGVPLWLAVHLVPLTVSGAPLGMLPLAPAIGVALLVGTLARRGVIQLGELAAADHDDGTARPDRWTSHAVPLVAAAAAVHAAAGVLAAALLTPDTAMIPADASPATAGTVAGLLAALAAAAGVAGPCGLGERVRTLPGWVSRGVRAGLAAATALVAGGAALLLVVLLAQADAVAGAFAAIAPQAGSGAGLWVLDAAYLPNAAVAAMSWLLGPGYSVGAVAAAPMSTTPGLLPPVPLAALLPAGPPPTWAGLVFALPLAVGSTVGWLLAPGEPGGSGRTGRDLMLRVRPVAVAALTAAVVLAVAAFLAGGRLGSGPFDPVVVPAAAVLLTTFVWIALPGAVVALLAAPTGSPATTRQPERDTAPSSGEAAEDSSGVAPAPAGSGSDSGSGSEAAAPEDGATSSDDHAG
ncbi:DUF6350 family protein [Actinomycetospora sp.]|uniref:cell division protein PerM n=1 Tax=Actinomycetospora sp. TaxID=1872135 RepID=UPI002F3F1832